MYVGFDDDNINVLTYTSKSRHSHWIMLNYLLPATEPEGAGMREAPPPPPCTRDSFLIIESMNDTIVLNVYVFFCEP